MGLVNQLASFIPDLAHCTTNLTKMTSTEMAFPWQDLHEADFILTKKLLTSALLVKPFNTKAHTNRRKQTAWARLRADAEARQF